VLRNLSDKGLWLSKRVHFFLDRFFNAPHQSFLIQQAGTFVLDMDVHAFNIISFRLKARQPTHSASVPQRTEFLGRSLIRLNRKLYPGILLVVSQSDSHVPYLAIVVIRDARRRVFTQLSL
jgi:hypothetical protein